MCPLICKSILHLMVYNITGTCHPQYKKDMLHMPMPLGISATRTIYLFTIELLTEKTGSGMLHVIYMIHTARIYNNTPSNAHTITPARWYGTLHKLYVRISFYMYISSSHISYV